MNKRLLNKKYRVDNIEHYRELDKKYYYENIEKRRKKGRDYYQNNKDKIMGTRKEYSRKWYLENKTEQLAKQKLRRQKNPDMRKRERLNRIKKLESIAGRPRPETCELCGSAKQLFFDHDHATGRFRGWLCMNCNTALGHARDNPILLQKMIDYLNNSKGLVKIDAKQLTDSVHLPK